MSPGRWPARPRRVLLAGVLALVSAALVVGGVRGRSGPEGWDLGSSAARQARGGEFAALAGVTEVVPAVVPFRDGRTYLDVAVLPVPRALWPDKPVGSVAEVRDTYMPRDIGASFGFTGELYVNGGLVAVAVGSAVFAALVELAWLRLGATRSARGTVAAAGVVAVAFHLFVRSDLAAHLGGALGFVLGVGLLAWRVGQWQRSARAPA